MSVFKGFPGLENLEKIKDFQGLLRTRKSPDWRHMTDVRIVKQIIFINYEPLILIVIV